MLKNKLLNTLILSALSVSALPALAEDAPAPASPFSSNVALTTNYLYRGISQTGAKPALQGGFDYANANGVYVGVWGSSISWISDLGLASNAGLELDTYGGYKGTAGAVSYDVGFLRYNYPGTYAAGVAKADTNEIYGAITYSIVTVKYSYSLGDTFGTPDAKGTNYIDLTATYPIPDTTYTVAVHYGKQTFKGSSTAYNNFVATVDGGFSPTYSDYKLTATKDLGTGYSASLAYSNTNATAAYTVGSNKLGKSTLVATLSRTF
jgi:uncharacterized protein (TIGR02001 family)